MIIPQSSIDKLEARYGKTAAQVYCGATPTPINGNAEKRLAAVLVSQSADDEGNAQCVYAATGNRYAYCDAFGWLHYTGSHWETESAESSLDRAIVATLKQRQHAAVDAERDAVIKCSQPSARHVRDCKQMFRSLVTVSVDDFDASPDELNVKNGVLNLRTGTLTPHDPLQKFTYTIEVEYDPSADYSDWVAFLSASVAGGPELVAYLQLAVGYSLTGHTKEECLWYIFGPSRSGKGTFTESLLALLGRPLGVEADFSTFTAKREGDTQNFDLAPLRPARFIVASESNRTTALNAAKIKSLTGGNHVRAAYKHRDLFTFRPRFKVWLVSNEQVNADVDDDAVWYRLKVIEFPNGHAGDEDKTLKERMKSPDNLRGVLRWIVAGAMQWYASPSGLKHPAAVASATGKHREDLDFVAAWLDECADPRRGEWTSNERAYTSYQHWCKENGVPPKTLRMFVRSLKSKGYPVNELKRDGSKVFRGIGNLLVNDWDAGACNCN